ncbi:response regulator [Ramlibacter sp. AW1]|uniref:Virulence sensor protein BvgS n=1 Tax=Ramlibacter aurantiacus TaxID=2801330 RepID=A0A936ZKV9_9BURK|nr:response regulator [Ramlibacter aurantiacus]MBL0421682.1 response regulator [Ramlibacter aurantiacus]
MTTPNDPRTFRRILVRNVALPLALGLASAIVFIALVLYLVNTLEAVETTDEAINRAYAAKIRDLEMEASLRGYLIAGDPRFLEPFENAVSSGNAEREQLRHLMLRRPEQQDRLRRINDLQERWLRFAQQQIELKRFDRNYSPGERLEEGRQLRQAVRSEFRQLIAQEQRIRQEQVALANRNAVIGVILFVLLMLSVGLAMAWRGWRDLTQLSTLYDAAFEEQRRQAEMLQAQAWLRDGQSQLGERLAGEQALGGVAHGALEFLSRYLGMAAGALYVPDSGGMLRAGTWGWSPEAEGAGSHLPADRSLVGECATERRVIALDSVPPDYLRVNSGLGHSTAQSVLLAPVLHEGQLHGVIELGLLRALQPRDVELVQAIGSHLGASIQAAQNRRRLQDMLAETQQLNEELQVQQEELRTSNEELEEHAQALKESQASLENQQAELEQTNLQLSEQTEKLEHQRDELRRAQSQLQARAEELQRASRYKSEFLANMSHELRTPLNSALILARLLADNPQGNLSEEQVRFAESIHDSGNDLLALINDVLDIAKVEAGKLEIRPEVSVLRGLVEGLRNQFEPLTERKGLRFELNMAPDVPGTLFTDSQRLEQILKNLLSNAVKFTDQGSVELSVRREGEQVLFAVRDSGIGIDPSQHELIFEAFRQADGTESRRFGGTGLGLSISRDLAGLLGGTLGVDSVPGQGSTFTLSLPLQYQGPAESPPPASAAHPAAPTTPPAAAPASPAVPASPVPQPAPAFPDDRADPPGTRRTVLVIEDDEAFARILFDLAHELGYRCLVSHHAEAGMQLAMEQQPQAVLLDLRLPDGSGLSLLQRLKDEPRTRHIPVHVVSAEDRAETALQMGAIGYAVKPATRAQLRDIFERLETKLSQKVKRVLLVEDDPRQRESVSHLIGDDGVEITAVAEGSQALQALTHSVFDCMIIDLKLPDMSGQQLLERMASGESRSFPPVIVYTGRDLDREEEAQLMRYSRSIIIKGARSPERLLDEVTLFLHQVEADLSSERQTMLRAARSRDRAFEGRRILVVDDDVRNIFALTSALEHKGARVEVARNGVEALQQLGRPDTAFDLVLMDIMMPEMDGYTAMREIRRNSRWQKLPIIAITAKAMRDDQEKCLAAGASDYLAKPIELERLFSLIRVWMRKI